MRVNRVKRALATGDVCVGTMVFEFKTPGIGRIIGKAGAEFAVFDMEHTGWSLETIGLLIANTRSTDVAPFVRIPATEYHFAARCLDVGAMGIMVPMVESAEQARQIVAFSKYPPAGRRGAAFGLAHDDYTDGDVGEKIRSANEESLIIALIETGTGVENVDEIASVDGIDVLWIGHFDLTNSLGIPAQFDHPHYLQAVDRVSQACERHGKAAGFMVSGVGDAVSMIEKGFRCLAYWGDIWLYKQALTQGVAGVRCAIKG